MSADEKKKAADIGEFLDVRNLTVQYTSMGSVIHAVNGISFRLNKGETLALVGEKDIDCEGNLKDSAGCFRKIRRRSLFPGNRYDETQGKRNAEDPRT